MDPKQISTSELETHCSRVIEPVAEELPSLSGFARGTLTVHGDLLAPLDEPWEAAQ